MSIMSTSTSEEGRCLTLETPNHFVVGCYVPNAGDGLKRLDFRSRCN